MSPDLKLLGTRFDQWADGGKQAKFFSAENGEIVVGILEQDEKGRSLSRTLQAYLNNGEAVMRPVTDGERPVIREDHGRQYVTYAIGQEGIGHLEGLLGLHGNRTRMNEEEKFHAAAVEASERVEKAKWAEHDRVNQYLGRGTPVTVGKG